MNPKKRHIKAAERVLTGLHDPCPVLSASLLGLASAWDRIELLGEPVGAIPNICAQLVKVLDALGANQPVDVWSELIAEFNE